MSVSPDTFQRAASPASTSAKRVTSSALGWRAILIGSLISATVFGFALGHSEARATAVEAAGDDLTRLLEFMVVVKTSMALAVAGLVAWRLAHPIGAGLASAYILATTTMFAAPGLIWQMQHVAAGALLFHGGLIGALLVTAVDGKGRESLKAPFLDFMRSRQRRR